MDREQQLIADFESCRLDPGSFHHAEHIRLAWAYVGTCGPGGAERRMCEGLRRLTAHVGAQRKYHETMTIAWTRLVAWAVATSPPGDFDDFARRHGWLFDKDALLRFYSRERLMSEEARGRWVPPDVRSSPFIHEGISPCEFSSSELPARSARPSSTPSHPATK